MYEKKFKCWNDFVKNYRFYLNVDGSEYRKDNFLFRGQMDSSWKIKSSFDRILKNRSKSTELVKNFEATLKRNQHPLLDDLHFDENMLIAFGQHHGLPTRMVDWTISPYIAAFFAFADAIKDNYQGKHIAVYAINKNSKALMNETGGLKFIELPNNRINRRLKSQMGQFTLSNHIEDNIEDYIINICEKHGIDDALWKFMLPNSDKQNILSELDLMNINFESIYPDIEGYIKSTIINTLTI